MKEIFQYLVTNKKYWLLPIAVVLLLLSLIIVFAGSSALSPFIYTLF
tara:strand:+ start:377 stop:517 length:141 start_codon:yes stop_codon:yes gene_type:complete